MQKQKEFFYFCYELQLTLNKTVNLKYFEIVNIHIFLVFNCPNRLRELLILYAEAINTDQFHNIEWYDTEHRNL